MKDTIMTYFDTDEDFLRYLNGLPPKEKTNG